MSAWLTYNLANAKIVLSLMSFLGPNPMSDDRASWVGALDMAGNLLEWTSTMYGYDRDFNQVFELKYTYPYYHDEREEYIPRDDSSANIYYRVVRGGSFYDSLLRTAYRNTYSPNNSLSTIGFRCVLPIDS